MLCAPDLGALATWQASRGRQRAWRGAFRSAEARAAVWTMKDQRTEMTG